MPSAEAKAAAVAAMVEAEKNPQPAAVEEEGVIPLPDTSESTEGDVPVPGGSEKQKEDDAKEAKEPPAKDAEEDDGVQLDDDAEKPAPTAEEKRKELAAERYAKALKRDERSVKMQLEAKSALAEAERIRSEATKDREEIAALRAKLRDPTTRIATLEKELGVSYEDYTRAYLNNGKRTPEDDIREIREQQDREKAENAKEREAIAREKATQAMQAGLAEAAAVVDANPEKYPILYAEHTTSQIKQKFAEAWTFIRQENAKRLARHEQEKYFSHDELAAILENELKPEYDEKQAKRTKLGLTESEAHTASGKPAGKVITSDLSSGSSNRPLTREEKRAQAIKML